MYGSFVGGEKMKPKHEKGFFKSFSDFGPEREDLES
jgi:hypothetical protein